MKNILAGSLNSKLICLFLVVAMVPMAAISLISFNASQNSLQERAYSQLLTLANDRATSIELLNSFRIQQLEQTAQIPEVINQLKQVTEKSPSKQVSNESSLEQIFSSIQESTGGEDGYHDFKIVSTSGNVLYAQDNSLMGTDYSGEKIFQKGLEGPYREYILDEGKRAAVAAVPVYDAQTKAKLGVLIAQTGVPALDKVLLDRDGLGETGETYLVSFDRVMISPSRFNQGYEFNQKADTLPVKECIENGKDISASIYPDYRGVPIFGASRCEPDLGFVVIAEFDVAEIIAPIVALQNMYIVTGAIIAGIVGTFAFFMSRSISRPIKSAANIAKKISEGNLSVIVQESKSKDEIGILVNSEKQMVENLRKVISEVQGASESVSSNAQQMSASGAELNSAVQQIATTVDQISRGSQTQAQRIEKSKQSVEQLADTITSLSQSAQESVQITNDVGTLSEKGAISAKEAGEHMNKIIQVTNKSAQKVRELAEKTNEITAVLDVIRQIADQTNLLALNAAIEAARAGEAGRGFAVVADEVRRLAENSAKSSEEIDKKLKEIQENAQIVVGDIEASSNEVNQGKLVIDSSLKSLDEIAVNIKNVSKSVTLLSESAQDQLVKVKAVSEDATEISAVSEENAAATEEASAAVEEQTAQTQEISTAATRMAELAEQLTQTISQFRLDGDTNQLQTSEVKEPLKISLIAKIMKR
ncbi:methyl-accepting chemotaxis protein [Candidatus Nitrosotenuis chungbukensis]|uniref:methyl-accepting chemotaxis protein n=1 Tax=Candidatus Nitrosotenuis chungbukensis TaxID=1353246 RepID=UPI0005B2BB27|nr:methyl-accepting chemotaxis protein [Candidatus Nitrosotenuis chungbukensis]